MPDSTPQKPLRTSGGGYFLIPAGPAVGTQLTTSGSANTYGAYVQMTADAGAAIFIVGAVIDSLNQNIIYAQIDIATGGATSESSVGEFKWGSNAAAALADVKAIPAYTFPYAIPVADATRIAARAADEDGAAQTLNLTLICINQADVIGF